MKLKTVTNLFITMTLSVGAFAGAMPKNATLIPAPREIRATGGEYLEKKPPKLEKVAGLPPDPAKRDFKEFEERAANYRRRLIGAHVNCAPLK